MRGVNVNMFYDDLNTEEQVSYLIKPTTGITATAGIGTNMYLCKIAMDIVAKHIEPDKDGVRIAELDEMSYRRQLWKLIMQDETVIPTEQISVIQGEMFKGLYE